MPKKPKINKPEADLPIKPVTLKEVTLQSRKRLGIIRREFKAGFKFLRSRPAQTISFMGAARIDETDPYYQIARDLSARIVRELGYAVVTGGGPGIMEAANRGAMEAGGQSIGITIQLPHEQAENPYLTKSIDFYYFFARKVMLMFAASAYVFFPGAYGTMDEFFEVLNLVHTQKIQKVPIILFGEKYWSDVDHFIKHSMIQKFRTLRPGEDRYYHITDSPDEVLALIRHKAAPRK